MEPPKVQRKLTTIFSTDVQGYSRLMADDETATIRTLITYKEVIAEHITKHGGRVVDSPGDNLLAEFGSVVNAVQSAVDIQEELKEKNEALTENRRMRFRIGINVGDVVVENERLYGDGVNIAARLESLAEGGGICISGDAYRQVRSRLPFGFEDLGEQSVKNIPDSVHAYRVREAAYESAAPAQKEVSPPPVPDKPSIAVLPFTNMSGDPEQEYFSDGITEDLITDLSKLSGLFVIARNSTFSYKGQSPDVRRVAGELGVRYVLEGSVRRAGKRVRINAQLIDAASGAHMWADRYDGDMEDIFALQDEITEKIVSALEVNLTVQEKAVAGTHLTDSVEAYELYLRGRSIFFRFTPEMNAECKKLLEKAIEIDPNFAAAYASLAIPFQSGWTFMWPGNEDGLSRALEVAEKAVALDNTLGMAHSRLGWAQIWLRRYDEAIGSFERGIELSPNDAETFAYFAESLNFLGNPERAIEMTEKAVRLDPVLPPNSVFHWGHSFYLLRRYDEAIDKIQNCITHAPGFPFARMILAVVYSELGRDEDATAEVKVVRDLVPGYTIGLARERIPYRLEEPRGRLLDGLRKAGLPDVESTSLEKMALPLPDKPSVAVLPFNNLSGDPEQEYFADGMTEDIITGLSRFRSLFVIARNSAFAYKDKSPDVREVARELGVRYVVEGSVRRGGERIRITGQLIDAETGNHLWAERYDRGLEDIFAVQDEVTEAIVGAIAPEIGDVERERAQRKPSGNLDAWDLYQRALVPYHSSTEEGLGLSIEQFDRVNEMDPTFAPAFAMAAEARWRYVLHFIPDNRSEILNQGKEKAFKAVTLDPRDPTCLRNDARMHSMFGQHDIAISKIEEAIALNPNDALSHQFLGAFLCSAGRAEEAIPHLEHAMRLSPRDIFLTGMLTHRAFVAFDLESYEEAFEWVQRASLSPNPRTMTFALLTAVLTKLGRQEEAQASLNDLMAHAPGISCAKYRKNEFGAPAVMERFVDALREAGLPE